MTFTSLWKRLAGRRDREAAELDDELAFHAEMKARELTRLGMSAEAANAEAVRSLGNTTLVREQVREVWSLPYLADAWQDCRYGLRALLSERAFTAAAVLALVLGIGVNAILFNIYNALALAPFAMRDAANTVQIWGERNSSWEGLSWPEYHYLREHTTTLSGIAATANTALRIVQRPGETGWNGEAAAVSDNYFDVIGTGFAYGRGFSPEAGRAVSPAPELVLHYDTWIARFGGDPNAVGRWVEVNGHSMQIVGVAAAGFAGPAPVHPEAWIPGPWRDVFEPDLRTYTSPSHCCVQVIGRLRPGQSREAAGAELNSLSAQFQAQSGRETRRVRLTVPTVLAHPKAQSEALPVFVALAVTGGLVLLLGCANVANLQIARAIAHRRELHVRLALGAGRGRMLRQMLVESLLLAALAGTISAAISAWAPETIVAFIAAETRGLAIQFDNDGRVIAFIAVVTALAAALSGLIPAWTAVRQAALYGLREGARATASGGRTRRWLLAAQVAVSAILVTGTALMVRVADHARHLDPGFTSENVVRVDLGLNASGASDEQSRPLVDNLKERLRSLPGVISIAHSVAVPLGNTNMRWRIRDREGARTPVGLDRVSANFHETLGIALLAGRAFSPDDEKRGESAIVNRAAAERLWPGENPLGKPVEPGSKITVVGVAANITTRQFGSENNPHLWLAARPERDSRLLIRHAPGTADAILAALPPLAKQEDRRFFIHAAPYKETVAGALRAADIAAGVAAVLGSLALLLACVGVYGVASYDVSQRTREIGVRMALGALPRRIVAMIVRQNLRTVAAGAVVGLAGALAFAQLLKGLLYGVSPTDPVALGATVIVLVTTALLSALWPAKRAAAIDPCVTLRED
jgi:putative ABC transport system permease protein